MIFNNVNEAGYHFFDFYAARDSHFGPGWFIMGRNKQRYGLKEDGTGRYVKMCGHRTTGHHPKFNGKVVKGWPTKAAAEAALANHIRLNPWLDVNSDSPYSSISAPALSGLDGDILSKDI